MQQINLQLLKDSLKIILLASIIGMIVNIFHPRGFTMVSKTGTRNSKIIQISLKEGKIKLGIPNVIFLDSRKKSEYNSSHIKGALNIPANPELQEYNFKKLIQKKDVEIVIYCGVSICSSSETLAKKIINAGYRNHIYIIKGGFPDWQSAGYPVEK